MSSSFPFRRVYLEAAAPLAKEDAAALLLAIAEYALHGRGTRLPPAAATVFASLRPLLDADIKPAPAIPPELRQIQCAQYVSMTGAERQKLLDAYGAADTQRLIAILNNYKGSAGKQYKSDYRAILSWCVDRLADDKRKAAAPAAGRLSFSALARRRKEAAQ